MIEMTGTDCEWNETNWLELTDRLLPVRVDTHGWLTGWLPSSPGVVTRLPSWPVYAFKDEDCILVGSFIYIISDEHCIYGYSF
jgi:hypothetical protein